MLLKSNSFLDSNGRYSSAIHDINHSQSKNGETCRRTSSSNPILQYERLNDVELKFDVNNNLPKKFLERCSESNFKISNKFSQHDNRNLIQDYGEYFGQGYGRKLIDTDIYRTKSSHLSHEPVDPQNYVTTNQYNFSGSKLNEINSNHRRYPRSYSFLKDQISIIPDEKQKNLTPNIFTKLKDKFIFSDQLCFLNNQNKNLNTNAWKYSYKKCINVYPNIKIQQVRKSCIDLSKY